MPDLDSRPLSTPPTDSEPSELIASLRRLADNRGAEPRDLAADRFLMGLAIAAPPGMPPRAFQLIAALNDACDLLSVSGKNDWPRAARAAMGFYEGGIGMPLKGVTGGGPGRAETIAVALSATKPLEIRPLQAMRPGQRDKLLEVTTRLASAVAQLEGAARSEASQHRRANIKSPQTSQLRVDWLARFQQYYLLRSPLTGVAGNLRRLISPVPDREDHDAVLQGVHAFAEYLSRHQEFRDGPYGGLIILPDIEAENPVSNVSWHIRDASPFTPIQQSEARIAFRAHPELADFASAHANGEARPVSLVQAWESWAAACQCGEATEPEPGCAVHRLLAWADFYKEAIDRQWDRIADWYDQDRFRSADPIPPEHYLRSPSQSPPTLWTHEDK